MLSGFLLRCGLSRLACTIPGLLLLNLFVSCAPSNNKASKPIERDGREVAFVTTPQVSVDRMLELCTPDKDDFVLDLGCGDGRILDYRVPKSTVAVGWGLYIDPKLIRLCKETAKRQGV